MSAKDYHFKNFKISEMESIFLIDFPRTKWNRLKIEKYVNTFVDFISYFKIITNHSFKKFSQMYCENLKYFQITWLWNALFPMWMCWQNRIECSNLLTYLCWVFCEFSTTAISELKQRSFVMKYMIFLELLSVLFMQPTLIHLRFN